MIDIAFDWLFNLLGSIFNIIWSLLCVLIYGLIVLMFNLFNSITQIDLLSSQQLSGIYQRVTMIITIVMVFYISFAFVKYVVSPDTITDKEKGAGKIVMRIITSILLIAFIPTIFTIGYELQGRILKTNVISKVIFGQEDWDYTSAGSNFAGDVMAAFYRVDYSNCGTESECKKAQDDVDSVISSWKTGIGALGSVKGIGFDLADNFTNNAIQFDGLLAVIFGCFVLYVLFSYNLDLVTRYIQLIFLQIMAPIAAISYIAPQKDSMLKKWSKQCITTYLDLFIRIAILYFMLLIISIISSSMDFYEMTKNGDQINVFLYIMVICGILIFVHRAPKLIKELFPSTEGAASIGFGFKAKDRVEPILKPAAATVGAVADTASTLWKLKRGKIKTGVKGNRARDKFLRGITGGYMAAKAGYKGATAGAKNGRFKEALAAGRESVQKDESVINKGGTVLGHDFLGGYYQGKKVKVQATIDELEARVKAKDTVGNSVKEMKVVKTVNSYKEDWIQRGIGDAGSREKAAKDIEKATRLYAIERNEEEFKKSIKNALDTIYGNYDNFVGPLTVEQEKMKQERAQVLNTLQSNLEIGSTKWETVKAEIEEAKRIFEGQQYQEIDKKTGNVVNKVVESTMSSSEFAEKIGDLADQAQTDITQEKYKDETKKAQANASESSK